MVKVGQDGQARKRGFLMIDLVVVFKEMLEVQDKAQELRLAGQPFVGDRVRGEKLEAAFNERMQAMPRADQVAVVDRLVAQGLLPAAAQDYMITFDGTWGSFKTDFHRVALAALDTIKTKVSSKDALELASHSIKHMGYSWDDFYKIMAEVRKILKIS